MSNRQLLNAIEELTQIINDDLSSNRFFKKITPDLIKIRSDLELEKRNVYLFSSDLEFVQSFHQLLNSDQNLDKFCYFQLQELPKPSLKEQKASFSACLVLREAAEAGGDIQQVCYDLLPKQVLEIGRKPGCDILIPNHYTSVSGNHLEVHYDSANDYSSVPQWQIQNCSTCRNGTFINGELLINKQALKPGDRIVLGNQFPTPKSPELIFEYSLNSDDFFSENYQKQDSKELVDCDILILIVDSHRELLEQEKKLLELANTLPESEVFWVALPHENVEDVNIVRYPNSPIKLKDLCLQMSSINRKQVGLLKAQRARIQILARIEQINTVLLNKYEKLSHEIKSNESQQVQESKKGFIEDTSSLLKVVKEQKESFSKSITISLGQAKHDLVDDSLADSIHQKIHDLIDELEACVIKQAGKKYLELKPAGVEANANDFIVAFCEQELLNWANEEWRKIRKCYGNGGLEGLVKSTNGILKTAHEQNNVNFALRIKNRIEFEGIFQSSLRKIPCQVVYHEDPAFIYFIKKIRSSVFQVMGILFLLSFLGLSRGSFIKSINKQISSSPFLSILAVGAIAWLLHKLYKTYRNDKVAELRKASEKVRKELHDYYQKVVKSRFVEKIAQILESSLKEEASRFDEEIKSFLERVQTNTVETKGHQVNLRNYLKECQDKIKELGKKLKKIQEIKSKLQNERQRENRDTRELGSPEFVVETVSQATN